MTPWTVHPLISFFILLVSLPSRIYLLAKYTQAAVTTLSYSPEALAKKESIPLTKEVDGDSDIKYDVNVGDDVSFTITSKFIK